MAGGVTRVEDPTFTYACWGASVAVLLIFGAVALWLARKHARDQDLQVRCRGSLLSFGW